MSQDLIEGETLIGAPLDRVWSVVAEPGFWVADDDSRVRTVAAVGETVVAKNASFGEFPVSVEKIDASTHVVAYRWAPAFPGDELTADNATLVEFSLSAEGDKTRLKVVESGFEALNAPEDKRVSVYKANVEGWPQVLEATKNSIEQTSA